jgi:hypothetical protein
MKGAVISRLVPATKTIANPAARSQNMRLLRRAANASPAGSNVEARDRRTRSLESAGFGFFIKRYLRQDMPGRRPGRETISEDYITKDLGSMGDSGR